MFYLTNQRQWMAGLQTTPAICGKVLSISVASVGPVVPIDWCIYLLFCSTDIMWRFKLVWLSQVASLGLVSPGAATEGVAPIFSLKKLTTFFCSSLSLLLISLGCHPLEGVTLHLFYLSDLVYLLFFVNSATNFFLLGRHPLEGVTRGGLPPPVMPLIISFCDCCSYYS